MTNTDDFKRSISVQHNTTEELHRGLVDGEATDSAQDSTAAFENFAQSLILHFSDGSTVEVAGTDFARVARNKDFKQLPKKVQKKARMGLDIMAVTVKQDNDRMERVRGVTRSILGGVEG